MNYGVDFTKEFARIANKNGMNNEELLAEMYYLTNGLRVRAQTFLDKAEESTYHDITKEDLLDYYFEVVRQCEKLIDLIEEV